jgi:aryl-alcohol dehydrogenase-like predicted oxidoreductase
VSVAAPSRIALGTAQLGQRYGVTNVSGPPAGDQVDAILTSCRYAGADTVDTAMSYGESETVLGIAGVDGFRVVTKLPPVGTDVADVRDVGAWVRQRVYRSVERLRIDRLHGVLLHRSSDASGPHRSELLGALAALQRDGMVAKIGVSAYAPAELDALENVMKPDLVQVPYNVLDRRFERSGWLARLHHRGVEVHSRSVFLQGLLLLDERELPSAFARWRPLWMRWCAYAQERQLSRLAISLGFALRNHSIDRVVVGVESPAQLAEIWANVRALEPGVPEEIASDDLSLINPRNWTRQ